MNQFVPDWAQALGQHILTLVKQPNHAAAQINIPTMLRQMQVRVEKLEEEVARLKADKVP